MRQESLSTPSGDSRGDQSWLDKWPLHLQLVGCAMEGLHSAPI